MAGRNPRHPMRGLCVWVSGPSHGALGVVVADPQIATATPGSLEEMTLLNLFCVALSASTAIFPDAPNVRIRPARSSTPATLPATSSKPFSKRTPDQDVAYTKHEFRRSQQCA